MDTASMIVQSTRNYVLGHSDAELRRLERQGAFYAEYTDDLMRRAGIGPGMRVLDVGCGVGDVALQAAHLVGPSGAVLGIDRAPEALMIARARAKSAGLDWCRFEPADIRSFSTSAPFDAVTGRLVPMYVADPAAALRNLVRSLRPGGIAAFQELEVSSTRAVPDGPLVMQCTAWVIEALRRTGAEIDMGPKLFAAFRSAGLPEPQMTGSISVISGAESSGYENLAGLVRAALPAIERLGLATAAEIEIDTLEARLREEAVDGHRIYLFPPLFSAWTRVPDKDSGSG
jgi:ubiquinone/menaquinone biosynthesis C-methylase UbiE